MKIILTGSTGFIGGEVLRKAISHPSITEIIVLSRRPLKEAYPDLSDNPKVENVIHTDYSTYPDELLDKLQGAEACVWSLAPMTLRDYDYSKKVRWDWMFAAVTMITTRVAPNLLEGKRFRFVLVSGGGAVKDQDKSVWLAPKLRKLGGRIELELIAAGEKYKEVMNVYIGRPHVVMGHPPTLFQRTLALFLPQIDVSELGAVLVDIAVNGSKKHTWENDEMVKKGRELMKT